MEDHFRLLLGIPFDRFFLKEAPNLPAYRAPGRAPYFIQGVLRDVPAG